MSRLRGILVYPISRSNRGSVGIVRKMESEASAMRELGATLSVVVGEQDGVSVDGLVDPYRVRRRGSIYWEFYLRAAAHLPQHLDFAYIRYPLAHPGFLWFIRQLRRRNPGIVVVVEVPTYPYVHELKTPFQRLLGTIDRALNPLLPSLVDIVVCLQGERRLFGIETVATSNGVDVGTVSVAKLPDETAETISVVGLGYLARWHGYDRIIRTLSAPGGQSMRLEIIGEGPDLVSLKRLAMDCGVGSRVSFPGVLTGAALDAKLDRVHLALGSLAEHRRGCSVSSTLKLREFAARGLPFVFSSDDADFPDGAGPWLAVASADEPLDPEKLIAFARRNATQASRAALRQYAETHLTWTAKLAPVMGRIRALHQSRR